MSLETLGGGVASDAPTWQYVQTVISQNIEKADDAIRLAEDQMRLIAAQYADIQNDAPTDWFVDVNVGTDALTGQVAWPELPIIEQEAPVFTAECFETELVAVDNADTMVQNAISQYDATMPQQVAAPSYGNVPEFAIVAGEAPTSADLPSDTIKESPDVNWPAELSRIDALDVDMDGYDFDVDMLSGDFSFSEPAYTERMPEVQTELRRVIEGDLGLSQEYWDAMWANVSGDIAAQQVGALRNARNRGAATYWGLPTEAVLTASRAVMDDGERKLQQARFEQAKQQAELARQDFWSAVEKAIAYEQQWINFFDQVTMRAFNAAKEAVNTRIAYHNANIGLYNAQLEHAKFTQSENQLPFANTLKGYAAELQEMSVSIEADKQKVARYLAGWNAYEVENKIWMSQTAEKIKWWATQSDAHTKYLGAQSDKAKIDLSYYGALIGRVETVAKAVAAMANTEFQAEQVALGKANLSLEEYTKKNAIYLDVAKITQAAQEIDAKLQIQQTQWLGGQGNALLQELSQLAIGLAQSLITVSDVNLGSSYSGSDSSSVTASRNAEKVW
jgi:hypothetical protein